VIANAYVMPRTIKIFTSAGTVRPENNPGSQIVNGK
jgi:hypothetical protein